jgi:hypothetical protein
MAMFWHHAAGREQRNHLIHVLTSGVGAALYAGANFNPWIGVFHQDNCSGDL